MPVLRLPVFCLSGTASDPSGNANRPDGHGCWSVNILVLFMDESNDEGSSWAGREASSVLLTFILEKSMIIFDTHFNNVLKVCTHFLESSFKLFSFLHCKILRSLN